MKILIREANRSEYPVLVDVWDRSVRATHHFLSEEDLPEIKKALPLNYFPNVDLYVSESDGRITGFIGLSSDMIEMLFVDADTIRKGHGSALLAFAMDKGYRKVDVNEQNEQALKFYLKNGFRILSRDETDSDGRPYPILHLSASIAD